MSEFPFAPPDSADPGSAAAHDRRAIKIGGGVLGALVLVGAGYLLLGGGGSSSSASVPTATRAPHTATAPATDSPVVPVAVSLPEVRNPFKALYVAPSSAAPGAGTGSSPTAIPTGTVPIGPLPTSPTTRPRTTPPPTTPPPTTPPPTTPPPTTPPPSTPPPTTPPPTTTPPKTYALTLVEVAGSAQNGYLEGWEVAGVQSVTVLGQRFGRHGELVVVALSPPGQPTEVMLKVGTDAPVLVKVGDTLQVR